MIPGALLVATSLAAQGAAPFNDSIRVADLRADLFFLAGDGFKGRLVGTPENALAADWVRSRFERAGLKPGAPNGTFVQQTQLMIATLGDGTVVGWSWLFPPYRWSFDARAIEDTRAIAFDGACLRGKCDSDHELGYVLMQRFAQIILDRLQAARLQLLDVYGEPAAG